ncbi:MAG TPA: type II toxin-antitoxin system ParD family antitoxin [Silvibacterium sp.]|nr:type II toxin-antitoxin system ParD family antitoxin [Silvibacterium sp.]
MPTMNISLSEQLKDFIDAQVNSGSYSSVSEYIRELVRADQNRRELELRVLEGLNSGEAVEATPAMWEQLKKNLRKRAKQAS